MFVRPTSRPLSVRPSALHGKDFNVGHYAQTFQPHSFILDAFIGTVDIYHFIPLLVNNNNDIIIIIIAFKGAIRDFFTISSLRRELSPTRTLQ